MVFWICNIRTIFIVVQKSTWKRGANSTLFLSTNLLLRKKASQKTIRILILYFWRFIFLKFSGFQRSPRDERNQTFRPRLLILPGFMGLWVAKWQSIGFLLSRTWVRFQKDTLEEFFSGRLERGEAICLPLLARSHPFCVGWQLLQFLQMRTQPAGHKVRPRPQHISSQMCAVIALRALITFGARSGVYLKRSI